MANNNFMTAVETPNFMIWISDQAGASFLGTAGDLNAPSTLHGTVKIEGTEPPIVQSAEWPGANVPLTEHTILYSSSFAMRKTISPNSGTDLYSAGRIQGTPLQVLIANGTFVANLEQSFVTGQTIAIISIVKLANTIVNSQPDTQGLQLPTVTEQNIFENCFIIGLEPKYDSKTNMDLLKMDIRYNKRTHTIYKYNQQGDLLGQNASTYDFTLNTSTTTTGYELTKASESAGVTTGEGAL